MEQMVNDAINGPQTIWAVGLAILGLGLHMALKAIFGEKHPVAKRVPVIFYGISIIGWTVWTFPWTTIILIVVGGVVIYFRKSFTPEKKENKGGKKSN